MYSSLEQKYFILTTQKLCILWSARLWSNIDRNIQFQITPLISEVGISLQIPCVSFDLSLRVLA